ncbi:MAG TPA: efflux RND transporter permease subunit [Polyangiaceae bacterium]
MLLFLRSVAASAIVALAIPICVLGTALGMTLLGRSVNVVSLDGITFAVGMVVDNSIVALENIDTWRKRVADVRRAALAAIREVGGALLASTATTAAVFIPIITWQGEVGELLRDVAYAISISVVLSLLVSLLVIPSAAARLLRARGATPTRRRSLFETVYERAAGFRAGVRDAVHRLTSSPLKSLGVVVAAVSITSVIALVLLPKMEYLPTGNRNLVFGMVMPPPGQSIGELTALGGENQRVMMQHTGKRVGDVPVVRRSFFVGDPERLIIGGVAANPDEVKGLRDFMQDLHARIPGGIGFATQAALFSRGIGEGRSVELQISGNDMKALIRLGRRLMGELGKAVPGARIRPVPVLDDGAAELHVVPNAEQAAALGITPRDIGLIADAYIDGAILGEFGREGERKVDIVLKSRDAVSRIRDEGTLGAAPVATPAGTLVPFGVLAGVEARLGPTVINRVERRRAVVLHVTPPDDMAFEVAIERVSAKTDELRAGGVIAPDITMTLGGSAGKLVEAQRQFAGILLIALVISYLLLAGLFENFAAPVVVMVTIPLAAAGGVLALAAAAALGVSIPLDSMSALGFLILIGVVVNNAILIVDGAIARVRNGAPLPAATADAVEARVRPIFMSTLASLAGLTPMVLSSGEGSELYRGVGAIVLGGLALSTLLALFVVPSIFVLLWRAQREVTAAAQSVAGEPSAAE